MHRIDETLINRTTVQKNQLSIYLMYITNKTSIKDIKNLEKFPKISYHIRYPNMI